MKKIRHNVFETNSSSTHSICVAKDKNVSIPPIIYFNIGQFGWEENTLDSIQEKASYIYTACLYNQDNEALDSIKKILQENMIEAVFEEVKMKHYKTLDKEGNEVIKSYPETGYVDHGGNLYNFISHVAYDKELLFNYLFSPLSFVLTSNDNYGASVDINVPYEHDAFYKNN